MKIYNNCYLFRGYEEANFTPYDSNGVLIQEALRLPHQNLNKYWSQWHEADNIKTKIDFDEVLENLKDENRLGFNYRYVDECVFVGGVTNHIGHFILESLSKLTEAVLMPNKVPVCYFVGDAVLPEGITPCPKEEIATIVDAMDINQLKIPTRGEFYIIDTLYVPEKPYILSHSCSKPWQSQKMISKIVEKAIELYPMDYIDVLHLKRFGETEFDPSHTISNPTLPLLEQISMIYHAKKLIGQVGSNTHMCIFAKYNTPTEWTVRKGSNSGHYEESYRNQAICDLIKTFNKFNF